MDDIGLYVHIPFCAVRCDYCDFNTYAGLERYFEPYTEALIEEIRSCAKGPRPSENRAARRARTIFVGGGTPTMLPAEYLGRILDTCRETFDLVADAEITSEANPGTVDQARFAALRSLGVNRLSMGVQSFDDAELHWLGRMHNSADAVSAFEAARAAGFTNINLDFIFGLPEQSPTAWNATLERAIALAPEHLSLYSLIVEPGTPLAEQVRLGNTPDTDDDLAADLYIAAQERLEAAGYVQYEISNWARDDGRAAISPVANPAFACQHNLIYWRDETYLGFGAGAHSYDDDRRRWNVRPVPQYIRRVSEGPGPAADGETIDRRLAMGETMMLGLRLVREGVSRERFALRFGVGLEETYGQEIGELVSAGLLEWVAGHLRLTPEGRLLGNRVFARFL